MPWRLPEDDASLLRLAKGYPYEAPGRCYLFRNGIVDPSPQFLRPEVFQERVPVIAHGSNRAPEQLARKFGADAEIPVSRALLHDYDVVYSAHMTRYGAIAANLQHLPGVSAWVWITWLTKSQLARMHETELGSEIYRYGRLAGVRLDLESGPTAEIACAGVYLSSYGCLALDGAPIALAAVSAEGRRHNSLSQEDVLALVRDRHRPGRALEEMVLAKVRDPVRRMTLIAELRGEALAPVSPHFEVLLTA